MNNIGTPESKDPDIIALREAIYMIGKTEPSEYTEIGIINGYRVIYMEDSKRYIFGYKKCAIFIKPRIERKILDIDIFVCNGSEPGDGIQLLCFSLNHIRTTKSEIFTDDTVIRLDPSSKLATSLPAQRKKFNGKPPEELQEKLEKYYIETYGFNKGLPYFKTTLGEIISRCAVPTKGGRKTRKINRRSNKTISRKSS
jgi:hypothetical protein